MRYNQLMESTGRSVRDLNLPPDFWESKVVILISQRLDSLDGCPDSVPGHFACLYNNLTSLAHAPKIVVDIFDCSNNYLTSLEHAPKIVGEFNCTNNRLTSLADIHTHIQKMNGYLIISGNLITSHILGVLLIQGCQGVVVDYTRGKKAKLLKQAVDILNKYLGRGQGRACIMDCQAEMLAAALDDFAQI